MIGFRVQVNQDRAVTIGLEGDHVVSVIITSTAPTQERLPAAPPSKQRIGVGGLQTAGDGSRKHVSWFDRRLTVGDTISVEVVEVPDVDAPTPRDPAIAESLEKLERRQLDYLLKKYGQP